MLAGDMEDSVEHEGGGGEVAMLGEIVRQAVISCRTDPRQLASIVSQFNQCVAGGDPDLLCQWLQAMTHCVSVLDRRATKLVSAVLRIDWRPLPEDTLDALVEFVGALVSACSLFGEMCMATATRHLLPSEDGSPVLPLVLQSALAMLSEVLRVAPGQQKGLISVLQDHCPHQRQPAAVQEAYLHGILQLAVMHPALCDDIMSISLEQCTKVDVDTRQDAASHQASTDADETQFMVELDEETDQQSAADNMDAVSNNKLDVMLSIMLDFTSLQLQDAQADTAFKQLWAIFKRTILPTYQCKNVQFVLFHGCSFDTRYAQQFVHEMVTASLDPSNPSILRQSAVAYVSSFLARAKYITLGLVSEALDTLLDWANEYLRSHNSSGIPQTQHVLFHSVCQAVMYTLCFRARHFMEAEGGEAYLNSLGLQGLVASSLEPLLACQPTVVTQFSRVMQTYELLYCQPYLRHGNVVGSKLSSSGFVEEQLEDFFPFDPMDLPTAWSYLADLYWTWQECEPPGMAAATEEVEPQRIAANLEADPDDFLEEVASLTPEHGSWRRRFLSAREGTAGSIGDGSWRAASVEDRAAGFMGTSPAPSSFHRPASRF